MSPGRPALRVPEPKPPENLQRVPAALNLLVFRDGRQRVSGPVLKSALRRRLRSLRPSSSADEFLAALLGAGELECAIVDDGASPTSLEDAEA